MQVNLVMKDLDKEKPGDVRLEDLPAYGDLWAIEDSIKKNKIWIASRANISIIREHLEEDKGKKGTPHLQIYFQLKNAQSWSTIKKWFDGFPIWFEGAYADP